jgi:hypothetical protein
MRPAFDDLPGVDDEDLVRGPDRGQPVGNHSDVRPAMDCRRWGG